MLPPAWLFCATPPRAYLPMSQSAKRNRELAHLLTFKRSIPDFPEGDLPLNEINPRPDFRVITPAGVVGIEHTALYHRSGARKLPLRAWETYVERIAVRARDVYESRGHPPVCVGFRVASHTHLNKEAVRTLARQLASVVEKNIPADSLPARVEQTWEPGSQLPRTFSSVLVSRSTTSKSFWWPAMSGFQPEVPPEYVANRIADKNRKYRDYRANCDEVWLLVVVDGSRPSSFFEVSGSALTRAYESLFERTYLLDFQNERASRLHTSSPGGSFPPLTSSTT